MRKRQAVASAVTRENRRIRWEGLLLGPTPQNWNPAAGRKAKDEAERGLVVLAVHEKSKFVKQVREGDVIASIAGKSLADVTDLQQVLNDLPPTRREIKLAARKNVLASVNE